MFASLEFSFFLLIIFLHSVMYSEFIEEATYVNVGASCVYLLLFVGICAKEPLKRSFPALWTLIVERDTVVV